MYAEHWKASGDAPSTDGIFNAREAGLALSYAGGELLVKNEELGGVHLTVCSLSGALAMEMRMQMQTGHDRVSVQPLLPGVYVANIVDEHGHRCTIKFRKQ